MREATGYAAEFLQLPAAADERARQMVFRQAMTSLARGGEGPSALASAEPNELTAAVQLALQAGLFDELDWLDLAAACLALHELISALGPGAAQRELGRRLTAKVLAADAASFTIVAARMAAGSARALLSHSMRARVALVMELPLSLCIDDGPLALSILSRRELARHWIEQASTSSLPWRRFASRIIERAAREASFRAAEGETHALRPFMQDPVRSSMARLLADREPLVWRYAAAARGMLAPHIPSFAQAIEQALDPKLTPTEWRRAATSLVARGAHIDPATRQQPPVARRESEEGKLTEALLQRLLPLLERDRGMAGALIWGLPRTADVDEAAAKGWLDLALRVEPFATAEALCDFLAEYGNGNFAEAAVQATLHATARLSVPSERAALRDALLLEYRRELEARGRVEGALRTKLFDAMDLFVLEGTRAAYDAAKHVLAAAAEVVGTLVSATPESVRGELPIGTPEARLAQLELRTAASLLRDVSVGLIEHNALLDLLRLGDEPIEIAGMQDRFETLREEIEAWIIERERDNDVLDPAVSLRRVRALLHLADSDAQEDEDDDDEGRKQRRNARWVRIARTLLQRSMHEPPVMLKRVLLAALARACDGLGREGDGDLVTPFLVLTASLSAAESFETLASATTSPDLALALGGYARFVRMFEAHAQAPTPVKGDSALPPALSLIPQQVLQQWTRQLEKFAVDYVPDLSQQSETYRALLLRLHATLHAILKTETLQGLVRDGGHGSVALEELEATVLTLQKLTHPALRRFGVAPIPRTATSTELDSLSVLIERVVARIEPSLSDVALTECVLEMQRGLPQALGHLLSAVLHRLLTLPRDATACSNRPNALAPLPNWVPARRSVGGFYLLRALAAGAAGSVFLAARTDERQDRDAERFALKVPEYSETAARTLTEAQFSKLFREEASALLVLPEHPNLSRFVSFDAGARPKPILVMEYIEGVTVENMLQARTIDVARAFSILDDLTAGLGLMHGLGIGHLDIKPSNLILRDEHAVLVDFGLAGRTLRPGCGTAEYGAPEVWLADGSAPPANASVTAIDVYATACVAFELLTGSVLFQAPSELAIVAKHLAHDGVPEGVLQLAKSSKTQELAELLCSALRHAPAKRIGIVELRDALRRLSRRLEREVWPLALASA